MGAFAFLEKPVSQEALDGAFRHLTTFLDRDLRRLLIIQAADSKDGKLAELLGPRSAIEVTSVSTTEDAVAELDQGAFDCAVVDLGAPGVDGLKLIEKLKTTPRFRDLPI